MNHKARAANRAIPPILPESDGCPSLFTLRCVADNALPNGLKPEAARHILTCGHCSGWISHFRSLKQVDHQRSDW